MGFSMAERMTLIISDLMIWHWYNSRRCYANKAIVAHKIFTGTDLSKANAVAGSELLAKNCMSRAIMRAEQQTKCVRYMPSSRLA